MRENRVKDIHIDSNTKLSELISQFSDAGGFVATKIATATSILQDMQKDNCTKFISFPADIMATGTRGLLRQLIEQDHVDVVVTTCGTLDHDNNLLKFWLYHDLKYHK
jgi:deoxyhypusine synthase